MMRIVPENSRAARGGSAARRLLPFGLLALLLALSTLLAGPVARAEPAASNASCTYELKVVIDPDRALLKGEGAYRFKFMEETNNGAPLRLNPVFEVTDVQTGDSGLSRELAMDPILTYKWQGWPDANQAGMGYLTHISRDYVIFGPEFLWCPAVVDPRLNTSGTVSISVPDRFRLVTDGSLVGEVSQFGFRKSTFNFAGINGRPRVLILTRYTAVEDTFGAVTLRAIVSPAHQAAIPGLMGRIRTILTEYEGYFGAYRFPTLTVVEAPQVFGGDYLLGSDIAGMGLKGVVLLASDQVEGRLDDDLLAHEIAHQWWGCLVGPDRDEKAGGLWLMEGMAEFATLLHGEIAGGATERHERLAGWARQARGIGEKHGEQSLISLNQNCSPEKLGLAYCRAPYVFEMIRRRLGPDRFRALCAGLVQRWAGFRISTTDLIRELDEQTGTPWRDFFDQWVYRKGLPRLEVTYSSERQADGRWLVRVECRQADGMFQLDVPLRVFAGAASTDAQLELTGPASSTTLTLDSEPSALVVDPDATFLCAELKVTRVDPLQMK